jgi:hypothetical protein
MGARQCHPPTALRLGLQPDRCATSEHRYVVIPAEPKRIVFECHGSLPPLTAWQQLVGPQGLPFDITLADAELRWTFGMSREWPDLGTYFARGTSED